MSINRRGFLKGLTATAAVGAVSTLDWLRFFKANGVPGTPKELRMAEAAAQAAADPHFLIYWFIEGGWNGYNMFNPVARGNDAARSYGAGDLNPSPAWSDQVYRPRGYGTAPVNPPKTVGNITYGYLAQGGAELFPDLAVVSSHHGSAFHSGSRFEYHYGKSGVELQATREANERTVLQAFCEQYGASYLLPHISWHKWLADGELSFESFPEGTGYFERLGPGYAHTIYGKTPADMRNRIRAIQSLSGATRDARIRKLVGSMQDGFIKKDLNAESVRAFAAAVAAHRKLVSGAADIDPAALFTDPTLRAEFAVGTGDEETQSESVNGNAPRSKDSPNTNVQALMAYELMTKGLSCAFFIESRDVRGFDDHESRQSILQNGGQVDQRNKMDKNLWNPLKALVKRLKGTAYPGLAGKSYWDFTTIVLCSEMGRTINVSAADILSGGGSTQDKYNALMDQDASQHWDTSSVAFLGGTVKGNTQWGKIGEETLDAIPLLPNGQLDPAFDPATGRLRSGMSKSQQSFVTDAGHAYSTALYLSGIDPAGKGKNNRPALTFLKK